MGSCFSSPRPEDAEARQRTHEIDRRLEEDYRRLRKEVKILLLGTDPFPTCQLIVKVLGNLESLLYEIMA